MVFGGYAQPYAWGIIQCLGLNHDLQSHALIFLHALTTGTYLSYYSVALICDTKSGKVLHEVDILLFHTASEEEPPQDMKAVLPPEDGTVFLVQTTLVQRRILMLLMKQLEGEISEVEVGELHEVSMWSEEAK